MGIVRRDSITPEFTIQISAKIMAKMHPSSVPDEKSSPMQLQMTCYACNLLDATVRLPSAMTATFPAHAPNEGLTTRN